MRIKLLFSLGVLFTSVVASAQLNLLGSQKQRTIRPADITRGVGGPGETCADAITAVLGANVADGPSSGNGCMNCSEDAENADWFVYQATSPGLVTIASCLQGVDTRVWIYESNAANCNNLTLIAASDDFCEMTSGGDEYASLAEFYVCSGKYYYIEWDDNWDNGGFTFLLSLTPSVGAELITTGNVSEYTMLPTVAGILNPTAAYRNAGSVTLTNVQSELTITKNGSPFYNNIASVAASLPACVNGNASISAVPTQDIGNYNAQVRIFANETEANTANNIISHSFRVDTSYARDNGSVFFPAPLETEGIVGHAFVLPTAARLTSVSIKLADAITPGTQANVSIYATDANGKPTTQLGSAIPRNLVQSDTTGWLTLRMGDGGLDLPAGRFFVGSRETATSTNIPLGVSSGIYTPGVTWINIPGLTPGFMNVEDLGITDIVPMIRANFGSTSGASVVESNSQMDIVLMPNPSDGKFIVSMGESAIQRISVIDATGKLVKDETLNNITGSYAVDLSTFAPGLYTVRILSGKNVINKKLVINR